MLVEFDSAALIKREQHLDAAGPTTELSQLSKNEVVFVDGLCSRLASGNSDTGLQSATARDVNRSRIRATATFEREHYKVPNPTISVKDLQGRFGFSSFVT